MKRTHKLISVVLVAAMMLTAVMSLISVNAATDKVYIKVSSTYGTPYCYMWNSDSDNNQKWPGVKMDSEGDGVFSYTPSKSFAHVIFNNGSGVQTNDLDYPGVNSIYILDSGKWETYDPSVAEPSISLSKKDGASFKSDSLTVEITVNNADSAYYTVDGGSQVSFSGTKSVTLGASTSVGDTVTLFVSAANANGTVTASATYTKKSPSAGTDSDGSTAPALGGYYATNPNGQVGKQAAITVDGNPSEWDSSMIIAQGVANDDPRVYRKSSMHEVAIDDYALYAAWDSKNLYLMWEMANVQDDVAPNDDFPLTQGNLWIYNLPIFFYISTDPSIEGNGTVVDGSTVWDSGITLDAHIDTVIAISTNGSNGPFVYKSNDDGKIVYNDTKYSSIQLKWGNKTISTSLWGIDKAYGTYNNRVPGDTLSETSKWKDFYAEGKHKKSLDMCYEMSIPLELLGISASELESSGIGIMKVSTFGTSGMNSLPADPSMWDNATLDYSKDGSSSKEKEDDDHITVPLARIGSLLSGGGSNPVTKPTEPNTTGPVATSPITTSPIATSPTGIITDPATKPSESDPVVDKGILGDADGNGIVNVKDATLIQKVVAGISTFANDTNRANADANCDKSVNVKDATAIQKYVAGIETGYPIGR